MRPSTNDWRNLIQLVRYNHGGTALHPRGGRFTHAEKMEYLALGWATLVMVVTGLPLCFEVPFLKNSFRSRGFNSPQPGTTTKPSWRRSPPWSGYYTIFNPDMFLLSKAVITGNITRDEVEREHAGELDEVQRSFLHES